MSSSTTMEFPKELIIRRNGLVFEHIILHPQISKPDLAFHFQINKTSNLYPDIITDDILEVIGLSLDDYKKNQGFFSHTITKLIYKSIEEHLILRCYLRVNKK